MAFSGCRWKIDGQEPFQGSVHCRILCSGDLQTMGRWDLVEKGAGVVRFIVQPVSTAMNLGGTTEVIRGRAERAHEEGGMGGK